MDGDKGAARGPADPRQPTMLPVLDAPANASPSPAVETAELFEGFGAAYERMRASGTLLFGGLVNVHAIIDVLVRKGVITSEEISDARSAVQDRVENAYVEAGLGVKLAVAPSDKYKPGDDASPEIDCEARIPLCRAACCTFRWALTEQDIAEGVVQWDLTTPYVNRVADDGYCAHCDTGSRRCAIYDNRPGVCRAYDCRNDRRIWEDFDNRVVNPTLYEVLADQGRGRVPDRQGA